VDLDIMWAAFVKYRDMWSMQYDRMQPPINVDIPFVSGSGVVGEVLTCTRGNWRGEPSEYHFQWQTDGIDIGSDSDTYTVSDSDSAHVIVCVVTATNDKGSTAAPPSNSIAVPPAEARSAPPEAEKVHRPVAN
jgi:hypothetical protein